MDYELAKELKDAGFQFTRRNETKLIFTENNWVEAVTPSRADWIWQEPTLSELIEVCGEEFESLSLWDYCWHADSKGELRELGDGETVRCESACCGFHTKGKTPTEAVARLWLALNKK